MKKVILVFGSIAGLISTIMFIIMTISIKKNGMHGGPMNEIMGYSSIILSMAFIFFGVRSYRQNYTGGFITFGKAFKVGILIALLSSLIYVISWEIIYYGFIPDFMDQFQAFNLEQLKATGASQTEIDATMSQMQFFKSWYGNPLGIAALTFLEPFPIGLVVTLISAAILRKKEKVKTT